MPLRDVIDIPERAGAEDYGLRLTDSVGHEAAAADRVRSTGRTGRETTMEIIKEPSPPTGFSRLLWRLPVQLYRARLGWLLGSRFLLLRHVGRISGRQRTAVIEVVSSEPGSWTVASGFGARADWYRNVLAHPDVTIHTAGHDHAVHAVPLDPEECAALMTRYARAHARTARSLVRIMGYRVDGSDADWAEVGRRTPFVRFEQRAGG